jgi:hypothetical protein
MCPLKFRVLSQKRGNHPIPEEGMLTEDLNEIAQEPVDYNGPINFECADSFGGL